MRYAVSSTPSLKIIAQANILPLLTTEVSGRRLVIGLKKSIRTDVAIRVEASGPSPESVVLSGTGDVKLTGISGRALRLEIPGAGDMTASGQVSALSVEISGSGTVDAAGLRSQDAVIDLSGSGNVSAHASTSVRVGLSGSGDIMVTGSPRQRSVDRSGAGDVTFR